MTTHQRRLLFPSHDSRYQSQNSFYFILFLNANESRFTRMHADGSHPIFQSAFIGVDLRLPTFVSATGFRHPEKSNTGFPTRARTRSAKQRILNPRLTIQNPKSKTSRITPSRRAPRPHVPHSVHYSLFTIHHSKSNRVPRMAPRKK